MRLLSSCEHFDLSSGVDRLESLQHGGLVSCGDMAGELMIEESLVSIEAAFTGLLDPAR